ncbi:MAG: FRG domain-containing protein [Chloroflexota bacterium]
MEDKSPYFFINKKVKIETISDLFNLAQKKTYWPPGELYEPKLPPSTTGKDYAYVEFPHETSGLFRGQAQNWPLVPSSYRESYFDPDKDTSEISKSFRYHSATSQLSTFCELASQQNSDFPKSPFEQMIIAQHYGIKTPLLDWTKNIFVAIYFALDLCDEDDENKNLEPYLYHIRDEKLLLSGIEKESEIEKVNESALVMPYPIDRRIERQFSAFSFHPHPLHKPKQIPLDEYRISGKLFIYLWRLLDGMGFSSSHYFPDYAGLADRIKQGYLLFGLWTKRDDILAKI